MKVDWALAKESYNGFVQSQKQLQRTDNRFIFARIPVAIPNQIIYLFPIIISSESFQIAYHTHVVILHYHGGVQLKTLPLVYGVVL